MRKMRKNEKKMRKIEKEKKGRRNREEGRPNSERIIGVGVKRERGRGERKN